jgi:hypothetical protein
VSTGTYEQGFQLPLLLHRITDINKYVGSIKSAMLSSFLSPSAINVLPAAGCDCYCVEGDLLLNYGFVEESHRGVHE